jgi:hypothetical protein
VSGKDQCEHEVIGAVRGNDKSDRSFIHVYSEFISVGILKQTGVKCLGLSKIDRFSLLQECVI